jgi:hypothetical protein
MTLGMGLRQGPRGVHFLVGEVPLHTNTDGGVADCGGHEAPSQVVRPCRPSHIIQTPLDALGTAPV